DVARVHEIEEVVRVLLPEIGDLRVIAGARADVAALAGDRPEELEEMIADVLQQAERTAAPVMEDRRRARLPLDLEEPARRDVEGLGPADGAEGSVEALAVERLRQPIGRVLRREEMVRAIAEEALRHRVIGVAADLHDPSIFDGGDDAADVGA